MAEITIGTNGCPTPRILTGLRDGDVVDFTNNQTRACTVSGLQDKPNGNPNGTKLSNKPSLTLTPNGGTGSVTISSGAAGTYDYTVNTCDELVGPPQMIVGASR